MANCSINKQCVVTQQWQKIKSFRIKISSDYFVQVNFCFFKEVLSTLSFANEFWAFMSIFKMITAGRRCLQKIGILLSALWPSFSGLCHESERGFFVWLENPWNGSRTSREYQMANGVSFFWLAKTAITNLNGKHKSPVPAFLRNYVVLMLKWVFMLTF